MFDVTAGHEGHRLVSGDALDAVQVVDEHALDLAPYAEAALTDEELLAHAWMELEAAELAGTRVLGRADAPAEVPAVDGQEHALDEVLEAFEARRPAVPADQLEVRRERRELRRELRALGGVA